MCASTAANIPRVVSLAEVHKPRCKIVHLAASPRGCRRVIPSPISAFRCCLLRRVFVPATERARSCERGQEFRRHERRNTMKSNENGTDGRRPRAARALRGRTHCGGKGVEKPALKFGTDSEKSVRRGPAMSTRWTEYIHNFSRKCYLHDLI